MPASPREALARWLATVARRLGGPPAPPSPTDVVAETTHLRPTALLAAARERVNWREEWARHVTPLHFRLRAVAGSEVPASDLLARRLRLHAANLCLLFTADWSRPAADGGSPVAVYAGSRRRVEVPLPDPAGQVEAIDGEQLDALIDLVEWAYGDEVRGDRLALVQSEIARALAHVPPADRFGGLLARAARMCDDLRANWKVFLEGELEEFLSQIQALEEYVAATVEAYSRQTADMIKNLSDSTLAAVGAVVVSIVAAVVGDQPEPLLLLVGAGLYLAYLVLLPLLYNMRQRWETHRALRANFEARRKRFALRLHGKVDEIVGSQVEDSERRFVRWFGLSLAAYGVVIFAVLVTIATVYDYLTR